MNTELRIGIVGGGPGGLMTAYHLQKYTNQPIRLTLLEATNRLGGKIRTLTFNGSRTNYEAGAAEFYDYSQIDEDPLKELVAELGLPITRMEGAAVVLDQKIIATLDDVRDQLGPDAVSALREFDRHARDVQTPLEFYLSDDLGVWPSPITGQPFQPSIEAISNPRVRRYIETLIHSDLATEPARTSLEYGFQNYLMNDPKYMRLYSIEGGNERLTQELARRTQANYRLNHPIAEVGLSPDGTIQLHGSDTVQDFDIVVLALPHQALRRLTYRGDRLATAMQRHLTHYNHPAHYLRITILFDQPTWRTRFPDSFVMLDQFGGCCLYDESLRNPGCRHGVLGWLIAGEVAEAMSTWDNERLIAAALDSLPEFMAEARGHFLEGRVHRWIGAVSAMPGGQSQVSLDRRHQPEPVEHSNLYVVGDYLFDSTLNGVLDSADYVARWIISSLTERSGSQHVGYRNVLAGRCAGSGRKVRGSVGQVAVVS